VAGELKKMEAFIHQEAVEKAREIEIKADEEFAIEKSKLVRQETAAIDAQYERKYKQAELSQQIARSTVTNKTRLKILAAGQQLLDEVFEKAREKLVDVSKDQESYTSLLGNLILEGLFALTEDHVQVRCRKKDTGAVKKAIEQATREYKEKTGQEVTVTVDEKEPIPDESYGGIIIVGTGGKITINNTLEERLRLVQQDSLPAVRASVFGENPNRKFHD